ECRPASARALPIVPVNGLSGTRPSFDHIAGAMVPGSKDQLISAASVNWSASRPKPGIFAVQPQPRPSRACGAKLLNVTFTASPGSAPSIQTGPETGLILPKSSVLTSATVDCGPSWPAELS